MGGVSAQQIIAMWDLMQQQHPIDKALTILACTLPNASQQALTQLTLGQINNHLIKVHEQLFGNQMACLTRCQHCQEQVEFILKTHELYQATYVPQIDHYNVTIAGYVFNFRLLNSEDLLLSLKETNKDTMYNTLIKRSLLKIENEEGSAIDYTQLPQTVLQQYNEHLQGCDPQAEILLILVCHTCKKSWQAAFDMIGFLVQEITDYAKQLLKEVHILAAAYGWTETTILNLSQSRRRYYLNAVSE